MHLAKIHGMKKISKFRLLIGIHTSRKIIATDDYRRKKSWQQKTPFLFHQEMGFKIFIPYLASGHVLESEYLKE